MFKKRNGKRNKTGVCLSVGIGLMGVSLLIGAAWILSKKLCCDSTGGIFAEPASAEDTPEDLAGEAENEHL